MILRLQQPRRDIRVFRKILRSRLTWPQNRTQESSSHQESTIIGIELHQGSGKLLHGAAGCRDYTLTNVPSTIKFAAQWCFAS